MSIKVPDETPTAAILFETSSTHKFHYRAADKYKCQDTAYDIFAFCKRGTTCEISKSLKGLKYR